MVVHLLTLRRHCAYKRPSAIDKVWALIIHFFIHQKIFLLGAHCGVHALHTFKPEYFCNAQRLLVYRVHTAKQRCLLIKRFAAIGAKRRGNAECIILYKGEGARIPCRIASCFKGGAKPARREGRCVRLALYKLFARKLHNNSAVFCGRYKAVMLFGGYAGERLKPMSIVRSALFNRPVLHGGGYGIGYAAVDSLALFDCAFKRLICILRQPLKHYRIVKYIACKNFINRFQSSTSEKLYLNIITIISGVVNRKHIFV